MCLPDENERKREFYNGPAWYLLVLQSTVDQSWFRLYNGQAADYRHRRRTHQTSANSKDPSQFVHKVWAVARTGRWAKFGILGKPVRNPNWTDADEQMWWNLGEIFFGLAF